MSVIRVSALKRLEVHKACPSMFYLTKTVVVTEECSEMKFKTASLNVIDLPWDKAIVNMSSTFSTLVTSLMLK